MKPGFYWVTLVGGGGIWEPAQYCGISGWYVIGHEDSIDKDKIKEIGEEIKKNDTR
jgi:hypothetical protein